MRRILCLLTAVIVLTGCTTVGTLGIVTKSSADSAGLLRSGRSFKDIGPAEGKACRYFLAAVIPWGNSDVQTAVDMALKKSGGDALVNVTTSSSLYGFIPIYNIFSFTCTTVKGTAIRFE